MTANLRHLIVALPMLIVPAFAVAQPEPSVSVNLEIIRDTLVADLGAEQNVPYEVEAPLDVAADVCGLTVEALTTQLTVGYPTCMAGKASEALEALVKNEIAHPKNG